MDKWLPRLFISGMALIVVLCIGVVSYQIVYDVVHHCHNGKYLYTYHGVQCTTTGGKHPITICYPVSYPVYQQVCDK